MHKCSSHLHVFTILVAFLITSCSYAWGSSPIAPNVSTTPDVPVTQTITETPTPTPTPLPSARIIKGDDALFNGDYQQALVEFQSILNLVTTPDVQVAAEFGLARSYYEMGDCGSAMQILTTLNESIYAAQANYFSAQCYEKDGNFSLAAAAYSNYISSKSSIIDAYIYELQGDALVSNGNYIEAINAYNSALLSLPAGDFDTLNLKICQQYLNAQDYASAVRTCMDLYSVTQSEYTRSTANLLAGQAYLALSATDPLYRDQAYARFQDSVTNYWNAYDSYTQLAQLVNDGIEVNDLYRGIIDYNVAQYGLAIEALSRYLASTPEHDGTVHFFLAYSYTASGLYDQAIEQYDAIINGHVDDTYYVSAWDEKAYTLWFFKDRYPEGAQVLLDFVAQVPLASESAQFIFFAARIYERAGMLPEAAATWERLIDEYPSSDLSLQALFLSAITNFRLADFVTTQTKLQRFFILSTSPEDQAAAQFWIAKCQSAQGDTAAAATSWQQAVVLDPNGYYGIRAAQVLANEQAFTSSQPFDLAYDLQTEREEAVAWLRSTFTIATDIDLNTLGDISTNINLQRGDAFYDLGLYELADAEFSNLRESFALDPLNSFRLLPHLLDLHMYRQAIFTSWQILDYANLADAQTLSAPKYFYHIRYGVYFRDLVVSTALNEGLDPLLLFSLIRQESLFEGHAYSGAGAIGLMQIMPATGQETAGLMGWPVGFVTNDLYRPAINIPIGTHYLARQRDYFGGNLIAALAAYNGGAGNAANWLSLAGNDLDLFVEMIRFEETRTYIRQISEFWFMYRMIYERPQQ